MHFLNFLYSAKQLDLYDETARPIVDAVLQGYNGIAIPRYDLCQFYSTFIFLMLFLLTCLLFRDCVCIRTDWDW